jgi:hypothetical protein
MTMNSNTSYLHHIKLITLSVLQTDTCVVFLLQSPVWNRGDVQGPVELGQEEPVWLLRHCRKIE